MKMNSKINLGLCIIIALTIFEAAEIVAVSPELKTLGSKYDRCACTDDWRPVCGSDGKVYSNTCGVTCPPSDNTCKCELVGYEGPAGADCNCDSPYYPSPPPPCP